MAMKGPQGPMGLTGVPGMIGNPGGDGLKGNKLSNVLIAIKDSLCPIEKSILIYCQPTAN
jgi:hypothetical protein